MRKLNGSHVCVVYFTQIGPTKSFTTMQ